MRPSFVFTAILLAVIACGGDSGTDPDESLSISGVWEGYNTFKEMNDSEPLGTWALRVDFDTNWWRMSDAPLDLDIEWEYGPGGPFSWRVTGAQIEVFGLANCGDGAAHLESSALVGHSTRTTDEVSVTECDFVLNKVP